MILYTFPEPGIVNVHYGSIDSENYFDGTPIEDFGDYLLSESEVAAPYEVWLFKLKQKEKNNE